MEYRNLLNLCKNNPGCISTKEQRQIESDLKYKSWIEKMNIEYSKK